MTNEHTLECQNEVHVNLAELAAFQRRTHGFSFLPRQPIRSLLAGCHASRLRGRGLNFEEIRRYQAGDDIRQIDWKVTARTRKTHTRIFTEERERTTLLVADQRITMFFGSVKNMKSVTAAQTAAASAWRVLSQRDRVGAIIFNDKEIAEVRPQRSHAGVMRVLHALVKQNQALSLASGTRPNPGMFNEALRRCDRVAKHDCLVAIISDAFGADEESRKILTRIARHNDVLMIFISDPLEAELPTAGPLIFSDGLRQLSVNTSDRKLCRRYRDAFAASRAAGRNFLLHRETPVLALNAGEEVPGQIRRQLGGRAR